VKGFDFQLKNSVALPVFPPIVFQRITLNVFLWNACSETTHALHYSVVSLQGLLLKIILKSICVPKNTRCWLTLMSLFKRYYQNRELAGTKVLGGNVLTQRYNQVR
jgi:hypothetical protein